MRGLPQIKGIVVFLLPAAVQLVRRLRVQTVLAVVCKLVVVAGMG